MTRLLENPLSLGLALCALSAITVESPTSAAEVARPGAVDQLQQRLHSEFAAAAASLRERPNREAAGDFVGARVAAQSAADHRARFLDLRRDLERLTSATRPLLPVAADRDPFAPVGTSTVSLPHVDEWTERRGAGVPPVTPTPPEASRKAWDMYRLNPAVTQALSQTLDPREAAGAVVYARDESGRSWGMFARAIGDSADVGSPARRAKPYGISADEMPQERPAHPFLVYRDPKGPRSPSESEAEAP